MTSEQFIEARRLLGYSLRSISRETGIPERLIIAFERTGKMPRARQNVPNRLERLETFLVREGLDFTSDDPAGVRLRRPVR